MEKYIKPSRVALMALLMAAIIAVYGLTLYRIQAIDTKAILDESDLTATTYTVAAARGSVLDRNGELLVSDRTVYDVSISRSQLLSSEDPNGTILKLIRACDQYGVEYNDSFPVTMTAPFEYYANATQTQQNWLKRYFDFFPNGLQIEDPENPDVSATELTSWMRTHYKIDYTVPAEDARRIMGVRWELEMRAIINTDDYVFASDIPPEFLSFISEQNLSSVSILTRSVREYHTTYAAHILGYLGAMDREEYDEKYKDLGYPFNATIGKTGVEAAFEEYLHGTDGVVTVYTDPSGAVNDMEVVTEARAGSNVYLSISLPLQKSAEDALRYSIEEMNRARVQEAMEKAEEENTTYEEPELARGGAIVVMDVNTGEVLALASYPTFNIATFRADYNENNANPLSPLLNRATQGLYNPGSTFKMVTAFAALRGNTISPQDTIYDASQFTKYPDYQPVCWVYPGSHGSINVVQALEKSCNYFFYTVADRMGITRIAESARLFGLGSHTGIEIGDKEGEVASIELKREKLGEGWWDADTLLACIGQGLNRFTPIELANYVATIANGGTHYNATILKSVASFDYSSVFVRQRPSVESVIDDEGGYIPVLQQGMRAVAQTGTASSQLSGYQVPVAAKTGTVQNDRSAMNDGVFVCYAPADKPEIAIAVVVEKGGSGAALITIAKDVLNTYFAGTSSYITTVQPDNSLLK